MVTESYRRYIRSDRWARKRQQVFAKYGKRCMACRTTRGPIQVHHLTYVHFGNERLEELRVLCHKCHRQISKIERRAGRYKNRLTIFNQFVKSKREGKV